MRAPPWLAFACVLGGCTPSGDVPDEGATGADAARSSVVDLGEDASSSDAGDTDLLLPPRTSAATIPLHLQHGAAPAGPTDALNALAYLPLGLRVGTSVDVIVHVHGFYNCVENVLADVNGACSAGGAVRSAHHLASQLESSGRNALLLLPEVLPSARDGASADVGALANVGGLQLFVDEALSALAVELGRKPALGRLIVQIHSGGYRAAAAFATRGGGDIAELYLLDGLYGLADQLEVWMKKDLASFSGTSPVRRYANVYTAVGGTLTESQAQATRVAAFALSGTIHDDRTTSTWVEADFRYGLLFKRSALDHDGVVRYYAERLWATSGLGAK